MTVKELIKILMDCPQDAEVELSVHPLAVGLKSQDLSIFDGKSFVLIYEGPIPMQRGTMVYNEDGEE